MNKKFFVLVALLFASACVFGLEKLNAGSYSDPLGMHGLSFACYDDCSLRITDFDRVEIILSFSDVNTMLKAASVVKSVIEKNFIFSVYSMLEFFDKMKIQYEYRQYNDGNNYYIDAQAFVNGYILPKLGISQTQQDVHDNPKIYDEKLYYAMWYTYVYATDWDGDGTITCRDDAFTLVSIYKAIGGQKDVRMAKAYVAEDKATVYVLYDNSVNIEPTALYTYIRHTGNDKLQMQTAVSMLRDGKIKFSMEDCWAKDNKMYMQVKNSLVWDKIPSSSIYARPADDDVLQSVVKFHGTSKCRYPEDFCAGWEPFDWKTFNGMIEKLSARYAK